MSGDWSGLINSLTIPQGAGPGTVRTVYGPPMPAVLSAYGYAMILKQVFYFPGDDTRYYYECATPSSGIAVGFVDPTRSPVVNEIREDQYLGGPSALFQTFFTGTTEFINGSQYTVTGGTGGDGWDKLIDVNNGARIKVNSRTLSGRIASANGAGPGGGDNNTSATYVSLAGSNSSVSIVKDYTETRLRVDLHITCYASAAAGVKFGIQINGTDYDVAQLAVTNNLAGFHCQISGSTVVAANLAAGTYTVTGRWLRTSGAGTLQRDGNDWSSLTVQEVGEA